MLIVACPRARRLRVRRSVAAASGFAAVQACDFVMDAVGSASNQPSTSGRWGRLCAGIYEAGKRALVLAGSPVDEPGDEPWQRLLRRLIGLLPTPNAALQAAGALRSPGVGQKNSV